MSAKRLPKLALIAASVSASVLVGPASLAAQEVVQPLPPPQAYVPDPAQSGFQAYLATVRPKALRAGVSASTFDRLTTTLTYNPRVVALDRSQSDAPSIPNPPPAPFAPYLARHVDAARINQGRVVYNRERAHLAQIEARTGVPAGIILGIYGKETNYGRVTGDFDLLRSLATLAYDGRRRDLFEGELIAAMLMVERGTPREALVGSWAGAFGYPQFLPSVYLRLARDGDGDGRAQIWNNEADALASIAHYLEVAGYKRGERWGYAVSVPASLDRASLGTPMVSPRCPRVFARHSRYMPVSEWQRRGIVFQGLQPSADTQLSLIEPDGPGRTGYLISGSYRAILDYNCLNHYALAVGLLGDAITS